MGKSELEKLREELYKKINCYGRDSPEALIISQKLDLYIVNDMKERGIKNENLRDE
jgi:hypothetical protein